MEGNGPAAGAGSERLKRAAETALQQAPAGAYMALFGPGSVVRVREAAYHQGVELGGLMTSIAAYPAAFHADDGAYHAAPAAALKIRPGWGRNRPAPQAGATVRL